MGTMTAIFWLESHAVAPALNRVFPSTTMLRFMELELVQPLDGTGTEAGWNSICRVPVVRGNVAKTLGKYASLPIVEALEDRTANSRLTVNRPPVRSVLLGFGRVINSEESEMYDGELQTVRAAGDAFAEPLAAAARPVAVSASAGTVGVK